MGKSEFVHLHVHSEFSLLDGANRIKDLVQACLDDGQTALALTDHGNMFGAVQLFKQCTKANIKPIIGCEVYIARESRLKPHHKTRNPYSHLTLLARNDEGYKNLLKLASASYLDGLHFRPRVDMELLAQHTAGISALSGCLSGEVNKLFLAGKEDQAAEVATTLRDMFGPEHFWLELQRNGIEIQDRCNVNLVDLSKRTGIPLTATNDIHYLRQEDCATQDVLICINTGAKRADENRWKMDTETLYFRTQAEMAHMFRDLPDSVRTTMDIADQVDFQMEFGKYHLPVFTTDTGESPDEAFDRLCDEGLLQIYGEGHTAARERLEYEKRVIREMGFVSYFLIVWDLIKWARDNGVPVGPGRGSAAGSIVAYVLDITRVCPLKYDLLFERFLNSARVSMPDIDIDFCKEGREKVLDYTRRKYGDEHVAQIGTFATLASRSVVRDVGRVLDVPLGEIDKLAKMIPAGPGAPSLAEALVSDKDLVEAAKDERYTDLFRFSKNLDGFTRHISTHAAGVVIADRPIVEYVPLCRTKEDVVTQYPGGTLEELGLLKMDYLGLRTLTIIDRTLRNIERTGGTPPDVENLPLVDEAAFTLLNRGDTLGVFQLESEGMRKLLARLRPDKFEDLIAVLALYRPGPLESGMDDMFIRRKHGLEEIAYPHESLADILEDTYGCIVYQEQVMLISNVLANFALNDADNLRKAMGKKKPEIMAQFSEQFLVGAESNGCARGVAAEVWDNIVKFGGYGFNKSHSTAYALITWRTAYLKAHHRVEFYAGNMSCEMSSSDKIKDFVDDAKRSGIDILPVDIERSEWEFLPENGAVRFGFGAIKGTGQKAVEALQAGRERVRAEGLPLTLHNLAKEVDPHALPRTAWEAIIKAGAFDSGGHNRGAVLAALDTAMTEGNAAASDRKTGQSSLFASFEAAAPEQDRGDGIDDSKALDAADTLRLEHEVLGFYLSGHPLEERAGLFGILSTTNTRALQALPGGAEITLGGLVVGLKEITTRAGKKMARFRLEDLDGGVAVTVFPRTWAQVKDEVLLDDSVVIVKGKLEERDDQGQSEIGVLLDEVVPLEAAMESFGGAFVVNLLPADHDRVADVAQIVQRFRGANRLFLEIEGVDGGRRRVRANERHGVRICAELIGELEAVLGPSRVALARM
ncbi:MAG: DNA polymerase III subunit alpha [Planctomycetota bacterium]